MAVPVSGATPARARLGALKHRQVDRVPIAIGARCVAGLDLTHPSLTTVLPNRQHGRAFCRTGDEKVSSKMGSVTRCEHNRGDVSADASGSACRCPSDAIDQLLDHHAGRGSSIGKSHEHTQVRPANRACVADESHCIRNRPAAQHEGASLGRLGKVVEVANLKIEWPILNKPDDGQCKTSVVQAKAPEILVIAKGHIDAPAQHLEAIADVDRWLEDLTASGLDHVLRSKPAGLCEAGEATCQLPSWKCHDRRLVRTVVNQSAIARQPAVRRQGNVSRTAKGHDQRHEKAVSLMPSTGNLA